MSDRGGTSTTTTSTPNAAAAKIPEPSATSAYEHSEPDTETETEREPEDSATETESASDDEELALQDVFLGAEMPFKRRNVNASDKKQYWRRLKQLLPHEHYEQLPPSEPTYISIAAAGSRYPPKKYCDITGQLAQYTDPKTRLRYATPEIFAVIRGLPDETVQAYLALRNARKVLK